MSTEHVTDLEVIQSLDFKPELPCEVSCHPEGLYGHHGPAKYVVRLVHHCFSGRQILVCEGSYVHAGTHGLRCRECGQRFIPRDETWQIIEVLQ